MENTWYHEGLRFQCTRCGHCCTGAPGFVWVNDEELDALAEFHGAPREHIDKLYTRWLGQRRSLREKANGDCIFYDKTAGCTVYSVRPRQCRTWPFWESNVRTPEDWKETCDVCPGSGQGELISAEEITRRLQVIKL
jgi:Fe-S-cluster containining protein